MYGFRDEKNAVPSLRDKAAMSRAESIYPIYKKRVASANKVAANLAKAIDCQRCREGLEVSLLSHYCNVFNNNNKASWPFCFECRLVAD
jgi:hypothetical protein